MTKQKSAGFERKREGGGVRQAARAASCNSPNRTEQNNECGLLTDKRAQGLYVTSRYGYCVVLVAHSELVAVGVAMSGSDVAEVDDERAVALKDTLLVGIGKNGCQRGAQLLVYQPVHSTHRFTTSLLFPEHLRNLVFRQSLLSQLLSYSMQLLTLLR